MDFTSTGIFYQNGLAHLSEDQQLRARAIRSRQQPGITLGQNERLFVDHSYKDYSKEEPTIDEIRTLSNLKLGGNILNNRRTAFPLKLYSLLEMASVKGKCDVISWQQHGRAFKIHDRQRFEKEVLYPMLNMKTMNSFTKQLSLYGFRRLTRGSGLDAGSYYHELFLSGRDFLTCRMERTPHKGKGRRSAAAPDKEPDFYKMPYCLCSHDGMSQDALSSNYVDTFKKDDPRDIANPRGKHGRSHFEGIPFYLIKGVTGRRVAIESETLPGLR